MRTPTGALYSRGRPRPPVDALHPPLDLRGPRRRRCRAHVPIIVRGEGAYVCDDHGKALPRRAGRAVRRPGRPRPRGAGRGRRPTGAASWRSSRSGPTRTRRAIELAERLASLRPRRPQPRLLHHRRRRGRRDRLEAGQAVLQADRQADQAQGDQPRGRLPRHPAGRPVDHRHPGGQEDVRAAGARRVQGARTPTSTARPSTCARTPRRSGCWAADRIAEAIEFEGPDTVAAVFLEPVQNSGGCFPPPPGYFQRVREICDEYDVLLVSDEVICAFGRIGDDVRLRRLRLRARTSSPAPRA